jgi:hypothetical protein
MSITLFHSVFISCCKRNPRKVCSDEASTNRVENRVESEELEDAEESLNEDNDNAF